MDVNLYPAGWSRKGSFTAWSVIPCDLSFQAGVSGSFITDCVKQGLKMSDFSIIIDDTRYALELCFSDLSVHLSPLGTLLNYSF